MKSKEFRKCYADKYVNYSDRRIPDILAPDVKIPTPLPMPIYQLTGTYMARMVVDPESRIEALTPGNVNKLYRDIKNSDLNKRAYIKEKYKQWLKADAKKKLDRSTRAAPDFSKHSRLAVPYMQRFMI